MIYQGSRYQRQDGYVMALALVILMVMSVLGISMIETAKVNEKMAGNIQDLDLALAAAENALGDVEVIIKSGSLVIDGNTVDLSNQASFTANGTNRGLYLAGTFAIDNFFDKLDYTTTSLESKQIYGTFAAANYVIEYYMMDPFGGVIPDAPAPIGDASTQSFAPQTVYRILAKGFGKRSTSTVVLESFVGIDEW